MELCGSREHVVTDRQRRGVWQGSLTSKSCKPMNARDDRHEGLFSWCFSIVSALGNDHITTKDTNKSNKGRPGTASGGTDTADEMAKDLSNKLTKEQKTKVAGLLSKTISGGEVEEIRSVPQVGHVPV